MLVSLVTSAILIVLYPQRSEPLAIGQVGLLPFPLFVFEPFWPYELIDESKMSHSAQATVSARIHVLEGAMETVVIITVIRCPPPVPQQPCSRIHTIECPRQGVSRCSPLVDTGPERISKAVLGLRVGKLLETNATNVRLELLVCQDM